MGELASTVASVAGCQAFKDLSRIPKSSRVAEREVAALVEAFGDATVDDLVVASVAGCQAFKDSSRIAESFVGGAVLVAPQAPIVRAARNSIKRLVIGFLLNNSAVIDTHR